MKIVIKLTNSQRRDSALRMAGISPQVIGHKPGTHLQRDRTAAMKQRRRENKHKGRLFND